MSLQNVPESASQRSDATVTVNSQATYRRGEYFHKEISVSNGSGPVWQSLSIQAVDSASSNSDTGNQFVPKSERMTGALRRIGNEPKLTIYPEAGHDSWTEAYNDPKLFEWFLRQKRE